MEFAWSYWTLVSFLVGVLTGGFIGHFATKDEEAKKAEKRRLTKFCPRCGEDLEPK